MTKECKTTMRSKKLEVIICPHCGREYLPSEIYLPNSFLGKANTVIRDIYGHIDTFFGKSMDLKETYVCDKCNKKFSVFAKVTFKTDIVTDEFNEEYTSRINKKISFLED